ncbi:hypothetical protein GVAV_002486 [Gurleya vavrai]
MNINFFCCIIISRASNIFTYDSIFEKFKSLQDSIYENERSCLEKNKFNEYILIGFDFMNIEAYNCTIRKVISIFKIYFGKFYTKSFHCAFTNLNYKNEYFSPQQLKIFLQQCFSIRKNICKTNSNFINIVENINNLYDLNLTLKKNKLKKIILISNCSDTDTEYKLMLSEFYKAYYERVNMYKYNILISFNFQNEFDKKMWEDCDFLNFNSKELIGFKTLDIFRMQSRFFTENYFFDNNIFKITGHMLLLDSHKKILLKNPQRFIINTNLLSIPYYFRQSLFFSVMQKTSWKNQIQDIKSILGKKIDLSKVKSCCFYITFSDFQICFKIISYKSFYIDEVLDYKKKIYKNQVYFCVQNRLKIEKVTNFLYFETLKNDKFLLYEPIENDIFIKMIENSQIEIQAIFANFQKMFNCTFDDLSFDKEKIHGLLSNKKFY